MKSSSKKTSKTISNKELPIIICSLYALNDGRLAIGGDSKLVIYNMKSYKIDIQIKFYNEYVKFILQLKDKKLFYYTYKHESEGPHTDEYFNNYLIELSDKNYIDKSSNLPPESNYNILREYSENILFGGITYKKKIMEYHSTNANGPKRIEKLVKYVEEPECKSDFMDYFKDKYNVDSCLNIDFVDFIILSNNLIAVLTLDKLFFYESDNFKKINKFSKISNKGEKLVNFNDNLLLISTQKNVEIYDYKNYQSIKIFFCVYPIKVIYVDQNKVFIGESANNNFSAINEYEIDNNGNYTQVYSYNNPHKNEITSITKLKDGRLITSSVSYVKIWS